MENTINDRSFHKPLLLAIVLLMVPLTGAGIDIYVPSLPAIAQAFHAEKFWVQLTIAAYLFGYGFFQPVFGSLSDRFGRRYLLIMGLFFFISASAAAPFSTNIGMLLVMRFIQGVSVAGQGVIARSILSDCFEGKELERCTNYFTIAWAVGPILAPVLGGYLQQAFGWHAAFYFLAAYSAMCLLLVVLFMPETIKHRSDLKLSTITNNFKTILTHRGFMGAVVCLALIYSLITIFNVVGPFLIQVTLHYSAVDYGHIALFLGLSWFTGNTANRILIEKYRTGDIILYSFILALTASIIMTLIALAGIMNLYVIVVPVCVLLMCGGIIFPNAYGFCLATFPEMGGTASSVMGSLFVIGAALLSTFAALLKAQNQLPLAITYTILITISLIAFLKLLRKQGKD